MSEDQYLGNLYQSFPVTIENGLGSHVWDTDNNEYIDCMGGYGVALVGHRNERVVNAIKSQIDKVITVHSSFYNKTREEFLQTLMDIAPSGLSQAHLNNSGAESVEAAIKFARKFTGKKKMVAMKGSYHGKSMGALSLTFNPKYRESFQPLVEKVSFSPYGDIDALHDVVDKDTAFVILEPIQGESGIHVPPEEFLQALIAVSPPGLSKVHLNNSGAESVEAAIKFARKFTGKKKMVAMKGSYHGKSMGALSLTFNPKYRESFQPLVEKVSFSSYGDIDGLRTVVDKDTAFVILEPIQGESGIHVPPEGFLQDVRKLCDENDSLLVFDEIQSGLGRTGSMWASEHWKTIPDIMCLAKGIAGGVPMGATLVRPDILAVMKKGEHSSTFGGNPLACAAGTATLQALTQDGLVENAKNTGEKFLRSLEELKSKHKIIREVRGK